MNRRTFLKGAAAAALVALAPIPAHIPLPLPDRLGVLTPREREIAVLMAQGLTNKEIAAAFGTSRRTLDVRVSQILMKLSVPTRAAAVAMIRVEGRRTA